MHPLVALARSFVEDWVGGPDLSLAPTIFAPDVQARVGTALFHGVDAYTAAVAEQLMRYPGARLTVQDLLTDGTRLAMAYSVHATSERDGGREAVWNAVVLLSWDGTRLVESWSQHDLYGRRRQLIAGEIDEAGPAAEDPWSESTRPSDPSAQRATRGWLASPDFSAVRVDDGRDRGPMLEVTGVEVHEMLSAGDRVAFAATWTGHYRGGLFEVPEVHKGVSIGATGIVRFEAGHIVDGVVVTDRLGLRHALRV